MKRITLELFDFKGRCVRRKILQSEPKTQIVGVQIAKILWDAADELEREFPDIQFRMVEVMNVLRGKTFRFIPQSIQPVNDTNVEEGSSEVPDVHARTDDGDDIARACADHA